MISIVLGEGGMLRCVAQLYGYLADCVDPGSGNERPEFRHWGFEWLRLFLNAFATLGLFGCTQLHPACTIPTHPD